MTKKIHYQGKTRIQLDSLGKKIIEPGTIVDVDENVYKEIAHIEGITLVNTGRLKKTEE